MVSGIDARTWIFLALTCLACDPVESADAGERPATPSEQAEALSPAVPEPEPTVSVADAQIDEPERAPTAFLGAIDAPVIAALRDGDIARVRRGLGGRTLAFRLTLEDGTRAYYKPEQSFSAAHWYSEVAAYYLDRELGFGRVPPVVGRRMCFEPLRRVAEEDPRLPELVVADDGTVRGAMIGWVEGGLVPWSLGQGWEAHVRVHGGLAITPYQRPSDYRGRVNGELTLEETEVGRYPMAAEEMQQSTRGELSDLIVFDFLISNVDRWGGDYTNIRRRRRDDQLVYLDNGAGFWPNPRLGLMDARLRALQLFRRETIQRLRDFDLESFRARLQSDPLAPLMPGSRVDAVGDRVSAVLEHVDALAAQYGDAVIYLD